MPKQPKLTIEILYDEEVECEKCGKEGAMEFVGEYLCKQCVCNDVFGDYNENDN